MAAKIPLPKRLLVHGYVLVDNVDIDELANTSKWWYYFFDKSAFTTLQSYE